MVIGGGFKDHDQIVSVVNGIPVSIEELHSDHEEADTLLLSHAEHASWGNNHTIVIQLPDTYVDDFSELS